MQNDYFAIENRGLSCSLGSRKGFLLCEVTHTEPLRGIDFTVERGAIFGLLGPNGIGSTTLSKILTTVGQRGQD